MKNNYVKKFFEDASKDYNNNFLQKKSSKNYIFINRRKIVLDFFNKKRGSFLDIATGTGEITFDIIKKNNFNQIVLIDISEKMLNKMKLKTKKSKKIRFINQDFSKVKFTKKFDYIVCLGIIAHFNDNKIFFSTLRKFSKKGSTILLQSSLLNFPTNRINKIFFSKRYFKKYNYKINYITEKKLNELFKEYGFDVITVKKYSLALPFFDRIFPVINYYIEIIFSIIFPSIGSEAIFLLKKK
jgi:ubiquinone/menaquinone biosynthesis C-methylase UbiE